MQQPNGHKERANAIKAWIGGRFSGAFVGAGYRDVNDFMRNQTPGKYVEEERVQIMQTIALMKEYITGYSKPNIKGKACLYRGGIPIESINDNQHSNKGFMAWSWKKDVAFKFCARYVAINPDKQCVLLKRDFPKSSRHWAFINNELEGEVLFLPDTLILQADHQVCHAGDYLDKPSRWDIRIAKSIICMTVA